MSLIKAQCTNCNAVLDVDNSNDAAICPHCGTPYIVEKAINNYNNNTVNRIFAPNANISVGATVLDADTLFDYWYLNHNKLSDYDEVQKKYATDFGYYYPTDPRNEFIRNHYNMRSKITPENASQYKEFLKRTLIGENNQKYYSQEIDLLNKTVNQINETREALLKQRQEEDKKENTQRLIYFLFAIILFIVICVLYVAVSKVLGVIVGIIVVLLFWSNKVYSQY